MRLDVFCLVYILLSVSFDRSTQLFFWISFCAVVHCAGSCFSGSMRSYVVCFMDPLHSIMRTTTDLDCFIVYFWTGRDLSPGLSSVTWVFVRLLSVYPFNFHTRSFTSVFPYFPYVNFVITCFSCLKFLVLCFLPKKVGWGWGAEGLSRSGFQVSFRLLNFLEFSYSYITLLSRVYRKFSRYLTVWSNLWHMKKARWPIRTINNSLARLCPPQLTCPRLLMLSLSAFLTCWRRPHWRARRVPLLMSQPATFLICQMSWQTLLHCARLNQFPRPWRAVRELSWLFRPPVFGLFFVNSAFCHWWPHARVGFAPFSSSKALSHLRGPRTTSQGPSSGSRCGGKLLPDRCYALPPDPWTWPRPGCVIPPYLLPLQVPGLPPVHTGPSRTFPAAVAAFPAPRPVLPTPGPATQSILFFSPALGPIFSRIPHPFPWTLRDLLQHLRPWPLFPNSWLDLQSPPPSWQQPHRVLPHSHHLRSLSRPPRSSSRPPRSPQWFLRRCLTTKIGRKTWRPLCFLPWKMRWWTFWVLLRPSRPWASLFPHELWALTHCGRRAPLVTEHHHGFRISPVQRERRVAPGPGAL